MNVLNNLYIALLHYPVYDKQGNVVTTSVTNMDLHDISRAAKTFGVSRFFIVTPLSAQWDFVDRILYHWRNGYGALYNPSRKEALDTIEIKASLDDVLGDIRKRTSGEVRLVITTASCQRQSTAYEELAHMLSEGTASYLLLFGTGWGIAKEIMDRADIVLEPISGPTSYNHLSVRSAVAIVLDRLMRQ